MCTIENGCCNLILSQTIQDCFETKKLKGGILKTRRTKNLRLFYHIAHCRRMRESGKRALITDGAFASLIVWGTNLVFLGIPLITVSFLAYYLRPRFLPDELRVFCAKTAIVLVGTCAVCLWLQKSFRSRNPEIEEAFQYQRNWSDLLFALKGLGIDPRSLGGSEDVAEIARVVNTAEFSTRHPQQYDGEEIRDITKNCRELIREILCFPEQD